MQLFATKQHVFQVGGVTIGGQGKEYPTVLVGSMFYSGDRLVSDPTKGIFDRRMAKELLDRELEFSQMTGNPRIIDIIAETAEAMRRYIDFIVEAVDSPFLIDSPFPEVRLDAVAYLSQLGLVHRAIYNSIAVDCTPEELEFIKDHGVRSAVILVFDAEGVRPDARLALLKGTEERAGLITLAVNAGLENLLIDVGVLDMPSISWSAQAIWKVKEELGYPCGCAPSNALYTWKRKRQLAQQAFLARAAVPITFPIAFGADFILYGPISNSEWAYPACALMDGLISYGARIGGIKPATKQHPLFLTF